MSDTIKLEDYFKDFFSGKSEKQLPGEHHFVAVYLVPILKEIFGRYPDYVNPDGTKGLPGDIIYCDENKNYKFSIEVKYCNINFTKTEYENWINNKSSEKPKYFMALGNTKIILCTFESFSKEYIKIQKESVKKYSTKISVDSINTSKGRLLLPKEYVIERTNTSIDSKIHSILKNWKSL